MFVCEETENYMIDLHRDLFRLNNLFLRRSYQAAALLTQVDDVLSKVVKLARVF